MKVLIGYASTEGQTRKIAEKVADQIREQGHAVELVDVGRTSSHIDVDAYDAVVVAASVHQRGHQESIQDFVFANCAALNAKPALFLSVSLSAAFDKGQDDAKNYIVLFTEQTGWTPRMSLPVAGALRSDEYDYFQQQILEHVVLKDRNVDHPEQDREFTDWKALAAAVETFLKS